jgi:hypothetical protein
MTETEPRLYALPDALRRKAFVAEGSLDEAIARAAAEVARLAGFFDGWMAASTARLGEATAGYRNAPSPATRRALFEAAHALRGEAGQLDYPLAGRIAGSLARLAGSTAALPMELVEGHLHAIRAILREEARGEGDPIAGALAEEFERLCEEALSDKAR